MAGIIYNNAASNAIDDSVKANQSLLGYLADRRAQDQLALEASKGASNAFRQATLDQIAGHSGLGGKGILETLADAGGNVAYNTGLAGAMGLDAIRNVGTPPAHKGNNLTNKYQRKFGSEGYTGESQGGQAAAPATPAVQKYSYLDSAYVGRNTKEQLRKAYASGNQAEINRWEQAAQGWMEKNGAPKEELAKAVNGIPVAAPAQSAAQSEPGFRAIFPGEKDKASWRNQPLDAQLEYGAALNKAIDEGLIKTDNDLENFNAQYRSHVNQWTGGAVQKQPKPPVVVKSGGGGRRGGGGGGSDMVFHGDMGGRWNFYVPKGTSIYSLPAQEKARIVAENLYATQPDKLDAVMRGDEKAIKDYSQQFNFMAQKGAFVAFGTPENASDVRSSIEKSEEEGVGLTAIGRKLESEKYYDNQARIWDNKAKLMQEESDRRAAKNETAKGWTK